MVVGALATCLMALFAVMAFVLRSFFGSMAMASNIRVSRSFSVTGGSSGFTLMNCSSLDTLAARSPISLYTLNSVSLAYTLLISASVISWGILSRNPT